MKLNKILKTIFNIAIVIAAVLCLLFFVDMKSSFDHAKEHETVDIDSEMGTFNYKLKHKAYSEVVDHYFTDRMYSMTAAEGLEKQYLVAEYANTAFLRRIYAEKNDASAEKRCMDKLDDIRGKLDDYAYTAEEIDSVISQY